MKKPTPNNPDRITNKLAKLLKEAEEEIKAGKVSREFTTADSLIADLNEEFVTQS